MSAQVSVVIPAYNREKTIGRAIRSVLEQTVPVHEVIVVDDCSVDGTVAAALEAYPACRVVRLSSNLGAQAARAEGIRAATGKWIAFLDSDDWWLPRKLELQLNKASEGFPVVHGPGLIKKGNCVEDFVIPALEGRIFTDLLRVPAPLYQCLLVKRECFDVAGFPDPAICAYQEWDMSLMLSAHYTFGFVNEPLFVYEVQEDSISMAAYRGVHGYEQIVNKWMKHIAREAGPDAVVEHYRTLAAMAARCTGLAGRLHYLRMGASLGHVRLGVLLLREAADGLPRVRGFLGRKFPWLRSVWRAFVRKGTC
jgi:glycosyltransferase involved in cell wall biosynthesis